MPKCPICGEPVKAGIVMHNDCAPVWNPVTEVYPPVNKTVFLKHKECYPYSGYRGNDGVFHNLVTGEKSKRKPDKWMWIPKDKEE